MSKFCARCGNEVNENAVVCLQCGCAISAASAPVPAAPKNEVQVASILGIIGIVSAWLFALVGHVTSIIGIVLGIKEYSKSGKTTGLILSIIGEACSVLSSIIGIIAVSGIF